MEKKWLIRMFMAIICCFILYYAYQAKKSYEESLKPKVEQFYDGREPEKFIFDRHGHAYRDSDDGMTRYIDDPNIYKDTVIPYRTDYTPPPPMSVEQLKSRKEKAQQLDEFYIKGKVIKNTDDIGSGYSDQKGTYDGILTGCDEDYN